MRVKLDVDSVIGASTQFWQQMLSISLEPAAIRCEVGPAERCLVGCVGIAGAWTGRIEVRMTETMAWAATAAMTMLPAGQVSEADALDATREIANMVAGTIKSCLPRPCTMTVPESAITMGNFCGDAEPRNALSLGFDHAEGRLIVRIQEHEHGEAQNERNAPQEANPLLALCPALLPA